MKKKKPYTKSIYILVFMSCLIVLLSACSEVITNNTDSNKIVFYNGREQVKEMENLDYYEDKRTGCVYVYETNRSYNLIDPSGKQVGCDNLDSLSLNEYLNLPIKK